MRAKTVVWVGLVVIVGCASGRADTSSTASEAPTRAGPSAGHAEEGAAPTPALDEPADPALPDSVRAWWPQIVVAAQRYAIAPELVALVVWLESNGEPTAVSPTGARGLMQLMPATAAAAAKDRGEPAPTEAELLDPERNLALGCAHLAALGVELGIALTSESLDGDAVHRLAVAYNGGGKVLAAWQRGEPLPAETERYAATLRERWEARSPPR